VRCPTTCAGSAASRTFALCSTAISVDIVFIALPHADYSRLTAVLHGIGDDPVAIHLVPDVFGLASLRGGVEDRDRTVHHLRESPLYGWNRVLKRAFDLGGAALALTSPRR